MAQEPSTFGHTRYFGRTALLQRKAGLQTTIPNTSPPGFSASEILPGYEQSPSCLVYPLTYAMFPECTLMSRTRPAFLSSAWRK